jgi:tRNA threonylcarbamoyladenosine biosynthesis protein TsaE
MGQSKLVFKNVSLEGLPEVTAQMCAAWHHPVLLLHGAMGAGKTTFTAALMAALGCEDAVSSPTFSLVNEYHLPNGAQVFHFDLYRVAHLEELLDMGIETYLDSQQKCVIEWPEKMRTFLPENFHEIFIEVVDAGRNITFQTHEQ